MLLETQTEALESPVYDVLQCVYKNIEQVKGKAEQTEVRKCLLSFDADPFFFYVAIQKFKDQEL